MIENKKRIPKKMVLEILAVVISLILISCEKDCNVDFMNELKTNNIIFTTEYNSYSATIENKLSDIGKTYRLNDFELLTMKLNELDAVSSEINEIKKIDEILNEINVKFGFEIRLIDKKLFYKLNRTNRYIYMNYFISKSKYLIIKEFYYHYCSGSY
jgi:hypothetical protein